MGDLEEKYVRETYDMIADHFDTTRYDLWKCVENFINVIKSEQPILDNINVLDAGCGNGKNMIFMKKENIMNVVGCDTCEKFVGICVKKSLNVTQGDVLDLKYDTDSFNYVICVAVIHHLSTHERRIDAIKELLRVLKSNGKIFLVVGSREIPFKKINNVISGGDTIIGWNNKGKVYDRYYYLFQNGELEKLCTEAGGKIISGYSEHSNWCVTITK